MALWGLKDGSLGYRQLPGGVFLRECWLRALPANAVEKEPRFGRGKVRIGYKTESSPVGHGPAAYPAGHWNTGRFVPWNWDAGHCGRGDILSNTLHFINNWPDLRHYSGGSRFIYSWDIHNCANVASTDHSDSSTASRHSPANNAAVGYRTDTVPANCSLGHWTCGSYPFVCRLVGGRVNNASSGFGCYVRCSS